MKPVRIGIGCVLLLAVLSAQVLADAPSITEPLRIAILAPINRISPVYDSIGSAIVLATGAAVERAGAVLVNRDRLADIALEKAMAASGLTDRTTLADYGQIIPADLQVFIYYNQIGDELVIRADLLPSGQGEMYTIHQFKKEPVIQYRVSSPLTRPAGAIDELAEKIAARISQLQPAAPHPPAAPPTVSAATAGGVKQRLAILQIDACPNSTEATARAKAITDLLDLKWGDSSRWTLIDRTQIDAVLEEKKLALAALSDRGKALSVAHLMGADAVVVGTVVADTKGSQLYVDVLHTASGMVIASAQAPVSDAALEDAVERVDRQVSVQYQRGEAVAMTLMKTKARNSPEAASLARQATERLNDLKDERLAQALPESKRLIEAALAMGPDNVDVQNCAGWVYRLAGEYDLSEKAYLRAIELAPNESINYAAYGNLLRLKLKDNARAEPLLRRAVELEGDGSQMPIYRLYLSLVLANLGRDDEAIATLESSMHHWNKTMQWDRCQKLADLLAKKGQWERVAELLAEGAKYYDGKNRRIIWRRAEKAYERIGEHDKAMQMLETGQRVDPLAYVTDRIRLATYLADKHPERAAAICYAYARWAEQDPQYLPFVTLLQQMHMPPQRLIFTGAVFDIDALRKRDVHMDIRSFEGFRYARQIRYFQLHAEDALGVPVRIIQEPLDYPEDAHRPHTDVLRIASSVQTLLARTARETHAEALMAMSDIELDNYSFSQRFKNVGWVTTFPYVHIMNMAGTPPSLFEVRCYSYMFPQMIKTLLIGVVQLDVEVYTPHCVAQACVCRFYEYNQRDLLPIPCMDCRKIMQDARPDWPRGPQSRPPIEAGPAEAALKNVERPIVLVGVGESADDPIHLDEAADMVQRSTGLPVVVEHLPLVSDMPRHNGYLENASVFAMTSAIQQRHPDATSICMVFPEAVYGLWPRWLPWQMRMPGEKDMPADVRCPVAVLALQTGPPRLDALPHRMHHMGSLKLPDGKTMQYPLYADLIIAALATAAQPEHQCWTFGCPTTTWENIGDMARCSPWLCDDCRKALQNYFQARQSTQRK